MIHFVRTFSIMRVQGVKALLQSKGLEIMEKLYTSKALLKMAGGRMHTFHPTPLDPPLVISYRNHQKSLAYFSHLAPLVFFTEKPSQRGGAWHNVPPKYAPAKQPQCLSIPHPLRTFFVPLGGAGIPG